MKTKKFNLEVTEVTEPLKGFAMKLTRNHDDADDLLQDTLLKALKNRDKFEEGTNLKAWLYTMMKNIFINKYRRAVKSRIFSDDTDSGFYINSSTGASRNEGEGMLVMGDISNAINGLAKKLREPFVLNYKGYHYDEIADRLHLPLGTVKIRIHHARKELMKKLSPYSGPWAKRKH